MEMVLRRLHQEKFMINQDKCDFLKTKLLYLGFVLSNGYIMIDIDKVNSILEWLNTKCIGDLINFHGLESYYRKFVRGFSHICTPILNIIKGDMKCQFKWTEATYREFEMLKKRIA